MLNDTEQRLFIRAIVDYIVTARLFAYTHPETSAARHRSPIDDIIHRYLDVDAAMSRDSVHLDDDAITELGTQLTMRMFWDAHSAHSVRALEQAREAM